MEVKYLVMVTTENNNKFYKMIPHGNTFTAEYGRLGGNRAQKKEYPMSRFDSIYNEKIRKGYEDKTNLLTDVVVMQGETSADYKKIADVSVRRIVDRLLSMASAVIKKSYRIESDAVTQGMVDEAQQHIYALPRCQTVDEFNNRLLELFATLPRKMRNVNDYLAKSKDDFPEIIDREQELLDVMAGQVSANQVKKKMDVKSISDKTILEANGIDIRPVTEEEEKHIKKMLGRMADKYVNAWRVTNHATQEKFDACLEELGKDKKVMELWHGSRSENWWSIITKGLCLHPVNVRTNGSMFGIGHYFALKAAKSAGYISTRDSRWARGTDDRGFLGIYKVIYGTPLIIDRDYYSYHGLGEMDYKKLKRRKKDADCLHALKGKTRLREDEIVIYRSDQETIEYLVEVRA